MPACVRRLLTAARLPTAAHLPGAAGLSRAARLLSMAVATLALAGCAQVGSQVVSQVGYYAQSVGGHSALLQAARPVDAVLADPATPDRKSVV